MYRISRRKTNRQKRILMLKDLIRGTKELPRINVFRSNKYIYATLVDDLNNKILIDVSAEVKKHHAKCTKIEGAKKVGMSLAKKAIDAGYTKAVFDRRGYRYHGRVKSVADGARENGLKF
jgi:large subunit ribosomal protein L18